MCKRHVSACQNISGNELINRSFQRDILQKLGKSQLQKKKKITKDNKANMSLNCEESKMLKHFVRKMFA